MPGRLARLALAGLVVVLTGCAAGGQDGTTPARSKAASPSPTAAAAPAPEPVRTTATNPKLRRELLAMLEADQEDRSREDSGAGGDRVRTERLRQIVARYGWPTQTLVGDDGATAAWAIAQHSDLDPAVQNEMLELMRLAAAAGEADLGELAYLTDRVAANAGKPQTYGTQMGCGPDGKPQLAPLAEPDRVDELRAAAGLPPLADFPSWSRSAPSRSNRVTAVWGVRRHSR